MIDEKRADKILKTIRGLEHELIADKVGKLTEDFIEESRENLKQQHTDLDKQR